MGRPHRKVWAFSLVCRSFHRVDRGVSLSLPADSGRGVLATYASPELEEGTETLQDGFDANSDPLNGDRPRTGRNGFGEISDIYSSM